MSGENRGHNPRVQSGFFFDRRRFGVPTTAGSGSDIAGCAILTRPDTDTKQSINMRFFLSASFLDARYIKHSPRWLLYSGVLDALRATSGADKPRGREAALHEIAFKVHRQLISTGSESQTLTACVELFFETRYNIHIRHSPERISAYV